MIFHEAVQLVGQTHAQDVRFRTQIQVCGGFHTEHLIQPLLQAPVIVLQCQVQHRALVDVIAPQGQAGADVIGQLRHQEALAQLRRARQDVSAWVEQAVDHRRPAGVHGVVELWHRHRFEVVRVHALPHFPLFCLKVVLFVILQLNRIFIDAGSVVGYTVIVIGE